MGIGNNSNICPILFLGGQCDVHTIIASRPGKSLNALESVCSELEFVEFLRGIVLHY